ncbi:hypothetical protein CC1G_07286 [Coprinopsis cinerea okayama7|uniref:SET domain-containing protein n=1 Tax=Coprinopsis cinerea (strain Okayama-7 / 130 / ATCC MYA-4618 / FGSC 9003) TaxID=240176 RepID=A8NNJ8_COPC7|nr:hypothetical protein CC1G_07286 [Coprinopsis cinerea okayama7\|eukprot:XP_001835144.2 hypothetical protein CC1G_07286 [Coprinopsis cinerea okayama7\
MGYVPTASTPVQVATPSTTVPNSSISSSNSAAPHTLHLNGDESDSALHVISDTPYGGRGAFATTNIPKGTLVLTSSAPYASVVLRKFRKEVCSWCFGYSFEKGKRKWDVRLGGERDGDGRGTNNSNGKNNTTTMATTIFFCSVECRERWVGDYRGPMMTTTVTTPGESGEGDGVDLWFQLYSLLERTFVQETATALSKSRSKSNSKAKAKSTANRNNSHTNSTLSTTSETLIHRLESLTADQVSNDVVNSLWSLADVVFADEKGVLAVLRQWALGGGQYSSSSPSDTSSSSSSHGSEGGGGDGGNAGGNAGGHDGVFLTEFELDCARFVLDGLFRRALQEYRQSSVSSSSSTTTTTQPDKNGSNADPDVINDGKTRKTGLGLWTDLLKLQDNEVNNVRCRPSILASFIRVFGFLKHVVFMTFKNSRQRQRSSRQGQRSPAASKTNGKCVDINGVGAKVDGVVEAGENNTSNGSAVVNDDSEKPSSEFSVSSPILDILRKYLWQSGAVRAITARDHSNVFGIWEQAEEEEDADCEMLGWGMYISGAYFNHDCSPNLKKRRSGRSMQFFTIRDVQAGEELCTNYIDIGEECSVEMRNEELEREWFFRCACGRCVRERGLREG